MEGENFTTTLCQTQLSFFIQFICNAKIGAFFVIAILFPSFFLLFLKNKSDCLNINYIYNAHKSDFFTTISASVKRS
jgi:hypothetical protein